MSKFTMGDKVKIVEHPKPKYCGQEGKVAAVREGLKGSTQPIREDGALPPLRKYFKYDVQLGARLVLDCDEEWLELP